MFKVVKNIDGRLYSVISPLQSRVEYKVGEWVYPNIVNSKLFVFDTIANVNFFLEDKKYHRDISIYSCEVKDPVIGQIITSCEDYNIYFFWGSSHPNPFMGPCFSAPCGTILCSAVKLLEKI